MAKLAIHALVGYHHPQKPAWNPPLRPPPSADARLLRDLKEQVTVLQKDISQQASNVIVVREWWCRFWKNMWGWSIFSQDFFHSFNLQWFSKKRACVTLCPKTFSTKKQVFSAHMRSWGVSARNFYESLKDPFKKALHTDVKISYVNKAYTCIIMSYRTWNIQRIKLTYHFANIESCHYPLDTLGPSSYDSDAELQEINSDLSRQLMIERLKWYFNWDELALWLKIDHQEMDGWNFRNLFSLNLSVFFPIFQNFHSRMTLVLVIGTLEVQALEHKSAEMSEDWAQNAQRCPKPSILVV